MGFEHNLLTVAFFPHLGLTQIPSIQIDGLKYEVLRSSNPRSFFNQIWPSAGHRIIGKFRWRFSQTFVIQVYIVEEAVSTWIVCFLWNHYCIIRVHSKFRNQEWLVTSIQFELLVFWYLCCFPGSFEQSQVVTTRLFEIPKRYLNCHGAGGLRATKDSTDTTPKAWFDIGDLVWSLGNSIEGLFFCSVNLNSSFRDRFHIEGKAMWSKYTAAVDNTSVFFLGFLILTWPCHL